MVCEQVYGIALISIELRVKVNVWFNEQRVYDTSHLVVINIECQLKREREWNVEEKSSE